MANEEFGVEVGGDCKGACTQSCSLNYMMKSDLGIESRSTDRQVMCTKGRTLVDVRAILEEKGGEERSLK